MNNISVLQNINQSLGQYTETTSLPVPAPDPIHIPVINVTDLYIGNLHLGEISISSINLDGVSFGSISKMGNIYYLYILIWTLFIFSLLQLILMSLMGWYLYKKRKSRNRLDTFNSIFLEN